MEIGELEHLLDTLRGGCDLPNGCHLYVEDDTVGGRLYITDEVGGGAIVWNTSIVDRDTILAALTHEARMLRVEREIAARRNRDFLK